MAYGLWDRLNWLTTTVKRLCCAVDKIKESGAGSYKVYTALLTQSGGNGPSSGQGDESFNEGVTYTITDNPNNYDLTIYGAPNNNVGTSFVSTVTTGLPYDASLTFTYNTGAPIVTVLQNTIGNIWWTYANQGIYQMNSNSLFTQNKTIGFAGGQGFASGSADPIFAMAQGTIDVIEINTPSGNDGYLNGAPIEIRVYN
jgi:hypothetical protein